MGHVRRRSARAVAMAGVLVLSAVLPAGAIPPLDTTSTAGVHLLTVPQIQLPGYGVGAAVDIADNGWVALTSGLWTGIGYPEFEVAPIPIPTNPQFTVTAIGSDGTLTGNYVFNGSGARRGFVRYPDGTIEDLPIPAGYSGFNDITPKAVSDEGYIVGTYQSVGDTCGPTTSGVCSFLASPGGSGYTVETLPGIPTGGPADGRFIATSIGGLASTTGIIVGGSSRTWTKGGGYVDLLGGIGAVAWDINANGEIAGSVIPVNGVTQAGFWSSGSVTPTLIPFVGADTVSSAWALNNLGEVVGWSGTSSAPNVARRAYVWDATNGTQALGELPGGSSSEAKGINENGRVVGVADSRAVIWDPDGGYDIDYPPDFAVLGATTTVIEGDVASYTFDITDVEGDPFEVIFTDAPAGLAWDAPSGVVYLPTGPGDAGTYTFDMTVQQQSEPPNAFTVSLTFWVNAPLVMDPIPDQSAAVGAELVISPTVSGTVSPNFTAFSGTPAAPTVLPTGAAIDRNTGVFRWTPTIGQVGGHVITIKVDDYGTGQLLSAYRTFTVTVGDSVSIVVNESIGVTDVVDVRLAISLVVSESVGVDDQVAARPPVSIVVDESVGVGDVVAARPPVVISVAESVAVSDTGVARLPVSILVEESVGVNDAVAAVPAVSISIDESVAVTDAASAQPLARVTGRVWTDFDGDGKQDSNEPGLAGVTIYLDLDTDGTKDTGEPFAVSEANGTYTLGGLAAGSYSVRAVVPNGHLLTRPSPAYSVTLTAGATSSGRDVGLDPYGLDTDGDGSADHLDGAIDVTGFVSLRSVASDGFTDRHRAGGTTFGTIVDRASLKVLVRDATLPTKGVRVSVADAPGETFADFRFCGRPELVGIRDGSVATLTCGSLLVDVESGLVLTDTADGAVVGVGAGASALIDEVNGVVTVEAIAGSPTITANGVTKKLQPGDKVENPGGPAPGSELDLAGAFVPLSPVRLFDTRPTEPGFGPKGKLPADSSIDVQVGGRVGIPTDAVAVVMNVTVTEPEGPSFVTVYPTGTDRPLASSVNIVAAGQVRPNLVTVKLGAGGKVTMYSLAGTHLLADVAGYYVDADAAVSGGRFVPITPQRLFDTRPTEPAPGPKGKLGADDTIAVKVLGVGDVPATGVAAVVVNVTATEAEAAGFVTAYPTGEPRPVASNVNLDQAGATAPNLAIVPLGAGGTISFYSLSAAHLLGDVTGYITDDTTVASTDGLFVPLDPVRVFDTREGETPPGPKGYVGANASIDVAVAGTSGVPLDVAGVVLNVTGTESPLGFLTAWERGPARPVASTLNFAAPLDTRANAAMLPVGVGGQISFYTLNGSDILADVSGYFLG